MDAEGSIGTSSLCGIEIFTSVGETLSGIEVPEKVANCCFGGADGTTLCICATSSVYRIRTTVRDGVTTLR